MAPDPGWFPVRGPFAVGNVPSGCTSGVEPSPGGRGGSVHGQHRKAPADRPGSGLFGGADRGDPRRITRTGGLPQVVGPGMCSIAAVVPTSGPSRMRHRVTDQWYRSGGRTRRRARWWPVGGHPRRSPHRRCGRIPPSRAACAACRSAGCSAGLPGRRERVRPVRCPGWSAGCRCGGGRRDTVRPRFRSWSAPAGGGPAGHMYSPAPAGYPACPCRARVWSRWPAVPGGGAAGWCPEQVVAVTGRRRAGTVGTAG